MPLPTIFRYPGGKARLLEKLAPHLEWLLVGQTTFHDVFTGGGSVLLYVADRWPRLKLHANDLNPDMAAFWRVLVGSASGVESLCVRVQGARPSVRRFYALKKSRPTGDLNRAFKALAVNRWSYGGLGNGPLGGRRQSGVQRIDCRWRPQALCQSIRAAHRLLAGRCQVHEMDAVQYVAKTPGQPLYLDPPYFEKGPGLYRVSMSRRQHLDLSMALNRHTRWVLSLDHPDDIVAMYLLHRVAEIHAGYSISKTRKTEHIYRSTHPLKPSLALSGLEATQGMEPSLKFLDRQVGGDFVKRVRKGLSKTLGPEWEANYRAARLAEKKSPKRPSRRI